MKKLVSRFMAVLMAMTMILSMSMTAFAADAPKGILTVNNTVAVPFSVSAFGSHDSTPESGNSLP